MKYSEYEIFDAVLLFFLELLFQNVFQIFR